MYNPLQSMNAFAMGQNIGSGIRNKKTQNAFSQMVGDKDYSGARDYAYGRGAMELGGYADSMIAGQEAQAQQAQTSQADAQKTKLGQLKSLTENMLSIPEAQRGEFLMGNWQQIEPIVGTDFMSFWQASGGDVSDRSLNEDLAMFRAQLGEAAPQAAEPLQIDGRLIDPNTYETLYAPPQEREQVKGADGYLYYADTGERVLPGVEKPKPTPKEMTPYQAAQISLQNAQLEFDREKFSAEQNDFSDVPPAYFGQEQEFGTGSGMSNFYQASFGDSGFGSFRNQIQENKPRSPASRGVYNRYRSSSAAKLDSARLDDINARSIGIMNDLEPKLGEMTSLLEAGVKIGPNAGARVAMGRYGLGKESPWNPLSAVVPNESETADLETFNKISTDLRLDLTSKTKGAISDAEWRDFSRAVPNWNQSPEGARRMIQAYRAINARWLEYQDEANKWSTYYGGLSIPDESGMTFDEIWSQYTDANPVKFTTSQPKSTNSAGGPQVGAVEDGFRFKGGDPADPNNWEQVN